MKKQHQHNSTHKGFSVLALTCSLLFTSMAQAATHKADFNGDGYGDLLVGVPYEDVNGQRDAGAVGVVYGSQNGLASGPSQTLHLDTPGNGEQAAIQSYTRLSDRFGLSVAVGDFDNDGIDDAAIGAPFKDYLGKRDVGFVTILYGSATYGLHGPRNEYVGLGLFKNKVQNLAHFGSALAVGDINGDHYDDLAIGIPGYDVDTGSDGIKENAGAIAVFFGSPNGIRNSHIGPHFIIQKLQYGSTDGYGFAYVKGRSEPRDGLGSVLEFAHLNTDGYADLAIGIPYEDIDVKTDAGGVAVLHGAPIGLTGGQIFIRDLEIKEGDLFGYSLAAGDFNGDHFPDLAIGAKHEDVNGEKDGGAVTIVYGSRQGLNVNHRQFWHQDSPLVGGKVEEGDHFGSRLAAGDFDDDGKDDLAVGVYLEDYERTILPPYHRTDLLSTGLVATFQGTARGLKPYNSLHQDYDGIAGKRESYDFFGSSLSVNDFNNDGKADLAIGVEGEDLGSIKDAGMVQVLYGNTFPLLSPGDTQIVSQSQSPNAVGARRAEAGDRFGQGLP